MAESVIRPIDWFKDAPNIRGDMDEASLREVGQSVLTYGQPGRHRDRQMQDRPAPIFSRNKEVTK